MEGQGCAEEQRQHACAQQPLFTDGPVLLEERCARRRRQRAPDQNQVDRRIGAADVAPVDHTRQPSVVDEDMARMQVAVDEREPVRRRQLASRRENRLRAWIGVAELRKPLPRPGRANAHVGARDRIDGQLDGDLGRVERAQEPPQRARERRAGIVREHRLSELAARDRRPAEERPGKRGGWVPDEHRLRDRQRQQRRERRENAKLAADAVQRDLTPWKTKDPALVDQPGRVVPALACEPQRRELELRELGMQQQPRQRVVDDDLRAPLRHPRETSAREPADYDGCVEGASAPVEARHKALLDALPDLLLRLRADGTYLEIGGDTSKLANPPNLVVGSTAHELLPADVADRLMQCVRTSLEQGRLATVEYTLCTHLGDEREFEVRAAPAGPDEVVAVVRDVTELRRAMRELTDSRARIVAAGDAERRRVERNLHDGAQQRLVTVALHLHLVKRRLETDPTEVPQLVESAQTELALALEEIRELVRGLHPRLLSDRGLEPALAGLAERSVLPVEIEETPSERLPPAVEAAAYYLAAEALANAGKHSEASQVRVRVSTDGTTTSVEVVDDGVGGADRENGSGLRGLADRVAALGGELEIVSEPGRGTALRATLPHDNPND